MDREKLSQLLDTLPLKYEFIEDAVGTTNVALALPNGHRIQLVHHHSDPLRMTVLSAVQIDDAMWEKLSAIEPRLQKLAIIRAKQIAIMRGIGFVFEEAAEGDQIPRRVLFASNLFVEGLTIREIFAAIDRVADGPVIVGIAIEEFMA